MFEDFVDLFATVTTMLNQVVTTQHNHLVEAPAVFLELAAYKNWT